MPRDPQEAIAAFQQQDAAIRDAALSFWDRQVPQAQLSPQYVNALSQLVERTVATLGGGQIAPQPLPRVEQPGPMPGELFAELAALSQFARAQNLQAVPASRAARSDEGVLEAAAFVAQLGQMAATPPQPPQGGDRRVS